MKRIVALVGDFYHQPELSQAALLKALKERLESLAIQLEFCADTEAFLMALVNNPDAAILFCENRIAPQAQPEAVWMTDAYSEQIVRYVEAGGGWLAWHSGLASYPPDSGYVDMLRGYFLSHPDKHRSVRYIDANEDAAFELLDEHYFVHCKEEETDVFLRSESEDGRSVAGWRHTFGAGRVCCLTPAHREEGMLDDSFSRELLRAVEWSAGMEHFPQ